MEWNPTLFTFAITELMSFDTYRLPLLSIMLIKSIITAVRYGHNGIYVCVNN